MAFPTDLELLRIWAERSFDGRGRRTGTYGVTVACTPQRQLLWIGDQVPDALAQELESAFAAAAVTTSPDVQPPALERCRQLLEAAGPLHCEAGPTFVFPDDLDFRLEVPVVRSDAQEPGALRNANPGNWGAVEWDELLEGRLGPWAMIVEKEVAVSICHTPGPVTARAAECGVWTHPGFRGRGYGAAVTGDWAAIMRRPGRHLFYSTSATNLSSQRVALRLGLRSLGWTWRLQLLMGDEEDRVHPLCSVRARR
jgi:RimJ/RimL family protein N-acetyltransferase